MAVIKVTGQILGIGQDPNSGETQITTVLNAPAPFGEQQVVVLTQSPTILGMLTIGQNMNLYAAISPSDISAIEGAVTIITLDSST